MIKKFSFVWALALGLMFLYSAGSTSAAVVPIEHEFSAGWHFISFPANPSATTPAGLFKDKDGKAIPISGNLHGWNVISQNKVTYNSAEPDKFFNNSIGHLQGYWLWLENPTSLKFNVYIIDEPVKIDISQGLNMISYPFQVEQNTANLSIKNKTTGQTQTIQEARNAGWVSSLLYTWDSTHQGVIEVSGLTEDHASYANLEPWQGYWLIGQMDNLELTIPVP